uniref:Endoglucanase n=1 Tax=Ananas comosus var. bracteatus TaxID=296719 RepID=A0A6V7QGU8_ANACO|nr:unnamed protein product [Ananas comosus var. bracteatus]
MTLLIFSAGTTNLLVPVSSFPGWFDVQTKLCKSPICYIRKFLAHYLCQVYDLLKPHLHLWEHLGYTENIESLSQETGGLYSWRKPSENVLHGGLWAYGTHFPQRIHHRGSSLPSLASHPGHIGCQAGFQYFMSSNPNPNILTGAVVGGPDQNDAFSDDRSDYSRSEPATYINAPLVGTLAYLAGSYGSSV